MSASFVQYAFWILPVTLQVWLLIVLMRRGLRRRFPYFFAYTAFNICAFAVTFTVYHISYIGYFFAYWTGGVLGLLFGLAVIYEIFTHTFVQSERIGQLSSTIFYWAILLLVLVGAVIAASHPLQSQPMTNAVLILERSVRLMQVGLAVLLFFFYERLGFSWKNHVFGITLGFGIYAAAELTVATLLPLFPNPYWAMFGMIKGCIYACCILIWIKYLWSPDPARLPVALPAGQPQDAAYAYASTVDAFPQSGFVSSVEATVERILSQANGKTPPKD